MGTYTLGLLRGRDVALGNNDKHDGHVNLSRRLKKANESAVVNFQYLASHAACSLKYASDPEVPRAPATCGPRDMNHRPYIRCNLHPALPTHRPCLSALVNGENKRGGIIDAR